MKKVIILFIMIFFAVQSRAQNQRKRIVLIVNEPRNWYFLVFADKRIQSSDTILLTSKKKYSLLDKKLKYDSVKIINSRGIELNKKVRLLSYEEIQQYKIFQFYYPSAKEQTHLRFNGVDNDTYPIELKGQNELEHILKKVLQ